MKRPTLRALIYPLIVIPIIAVAVSALMLCLRAGQVPSTLVNSGVARWFAGRVGIQYSLRSLHFGCFQADCRTQIDAGGLDLRIPEVGHLHVTVGNLHWCPAHPITVEGLGLRGSSMSTISAGSVEVSTTARTAEIRDFSIDRETDGPITIREISTSPVDLRTTDGRLSIETVAVRGVNADIGRSSENICQQTQAMFAARDSMAALSQNGRAWLERVIGRIRRDLFYLGITLPCALFGLKLLATAWTRWRDRLLLAAAAVGLPLLVYFVFRNSVQTRIVVLTAFVASLALAIFLWARFYRSAIHGYQRWEPVTVDVVCAIVILPWIAYNVDVNLQMESPTTVAVGSVNVEDSSFMVQSEQCGENRTIRTRLARFGLQGLEVRLPDAVSDRTALRINGVNVPDIQLDLPNVQLSNLNADVNGLSIEIDGKTRQLQNIEAGFRISGIGSTDRTGSIRFAAEKGSIAFAQQSCALAYEAAVEIATRPVGAKLDVTGDLNNVRFRNLRTSAGSVVNIAGGTGTVSFGDNVAASLRLAGIGGNVGDASIAARSTDVAVNVPGPCTTGSQSVTLAAHGAEVSGARGSSTVERTDLRFLRQPSGQVSFTLDLQNTRFSLAGREIFGNVPALKFTIAGMAPGLALPRSFNGEFRIVARSGNDVILDHRSPFVLAADIERRTWALAPQDQVLLQGAIPDFPFELPLRLAANGMGSNIEASVHVPHLPLSLGPAPAELNRLDVKIARDVVDFNTDWNRVTLPSTPAAYCLDEIGTFNLSTAGDIDGLAEPRLSATGDTAFATSFPCFDLPRIPSQEEFRVSGGLPVSAERPVLRVEGRSGWGIEIGSLASTIRRLDLTDGRLRKLELESQSSGVRVMGRAGESSARTQVTISEAAATTISSTVTRANAGGITNVALDLEVTPATLKFSAAEVGPGNKVSGEAAFAGNKLTRLTATGVLPGGPLTSVEGYQIGTGSSVFAIDFNGEALRLDADLKQLNIARSGHPGINVSAGADLRALVRGRLSGERPPQREVIGLISGVARNLMESYTKVSPTGSSAGKYKWELNLSNSMPAEPLFRMGTNDIEIRFAANLDDLHAGAWRINGKTGFDGDLKIYEGQLVADAFVPIHLRTSQAGSLTNAIDVDLPVLIVFNEHLKKATTTERLWDSSHYESFWSNYQTGQSSRGTTSLIDDVRFTAGALSIRELVAPVQPLRIALGHAEGVSVHVPLTARLLHGTARGFLDAAVEWPGADMSLDSRAQLQLRNIQAGALGLDYGGGHVPFLEHEIDGDLFVSTKGWPLTLNGISFGVDLRTSGRNESIPGMLQLRNASSVRTLNQVLDKIIGDIQLKVPPSTAFFRNMALSFNVDNGKVRTTRPWLSIEGLRIFSSDDLTLEGNIRLHGARNGETVDLRDLLGNFQVRVPDGRR